MSIAEYNTVLPENMLRIINSRGLKQKAIAKKAGYSAQGFSNMLNGRKLIKPYDIINIANALEVEPNDLFYRG